MKDINYLVRDIVKPITKNYSPVLLILTRNWENIIGEKLMYYLTEHKDVATTLINKFLKALQVREAVRKAREEARTGKKAVKQERIISDKLALLAEDDK